MKSSVKSPMKTLQKWLRGGCVYFTVIALFFTVIDFLSETSGILASERFLLIFPAALTISAAGLILHNESFPRWGCGYSLSSILRNPLAEYTVYFPTFSPLSARRGGDSITDAYIVLGIGKTTITFLFSLSKS